MPASRPIPPTLLPFVLLGAFVGSSCAQGAKPVEANAEKATDSVEAATTAAAIDRILAEHWKAQSIQPAAAADDATFRRRLTLDLCGRLPTPAELDAFLQDRDPARREKLIDELLRAGDFPLHFARVVDAWVQGRQSGDEAFVGWLRKSLADDRHWNELFRAMLVGPWSDEAERPAAKFLQKRAKNLDALTADSAQVFFGVDISCARCHDHPLVDDWKQRHYYGLAAFFGRTKEDKKAPGGVVEKNEGEVTYSAGGKQETAPMMFLTGAVVKTAAKENRRERLVGTALDERRLFSRAAVNRVWAWFFGRGLVHPVEQMHSANGPSVPKLLDRLADDFVAADYDLRFLVGAIVRSRAYQLSSRVDASAERDPPEDAFVAARLRPLTREQFALSAELALGDESFAKAADAASRREAYLAAEKRASAWWSRLDPVGSPHQSSAAEALFLSNHKTVAELTKPNGANLAARLLETTGADKSSTDRAVVVAAYRTLLGRTPTDDEQTIAVAWLADCDDRAAAVTGLLWSLVTSAEFRFNH